MSKESDIKVAKQLIEDFINKQQQIIIYTVFDDWDFNEEGNEDWFHFYEYDNAKLKDLTSDKHIEVNQNYRNFPYAFTIVGEKNSLTHYCQKTFNDNYIKNFCEYRIFLEVIKEDHRVKLSISENQTIILEKI